jgi:hypothetical protein
MPLLVFPIGGRWLAFISANENGQISYGSKQIARVQSQARRKLLSDRPALRQGQ